MSPPLRPRSAMWKWWVCGLFLLASAINYMDRQTLANAAVRISQQFSLSQEQYGNLELVFGWAFAVGSIFFGVIVDRGDVRWVYPVILFFWSGAGFATGSVTNYTGLLLCRTFLGFFEAGHWPCAIKATQRLLEPKDRSLGNSVLQGGTSIGAVITPLLMSALLTSQLGSWRLPFQVIGLIGLLWIILWFVSVRQDDLKAPDSVARNVDMSDNVWKVLFSRRMIVTIIIISLINTGWQIIRAWLPKFLMQGRGYPESQTLYFNSLFYVATDIGCIGAGLLTVWLSRRGHSVHAARQRAFLVCALLSSLTLVAAWLPRGPLLLGALLLVGAGALGVFPIYHAFTQDISVSHQGKVTGIAGVAAWALAPAHKYLGRYIDRTGSFDFGFAIIGCMPLLAFLVLSLFWEKGRRQSEVAKNP